MAQQFQSINLMEGDERAGIKNADLGNHDFLMARSSCSHSSGVMSKYGIPKEPDQRIKVSKSRLSSSAARPPEITCRRYKSRTMISSAVRSICSGESPSSSVTL